MKTKTSNLALAVAAAVAISAASQPTGVFAVSGGPEAQRAAGQEEKAGHSHEKCELHGGEVVMSPANHFEVLFTDHEARVYVYDEKQAPIVSLEDAKASMTLQTKTGKSAALPMTVLKPDRATGRTQGVLAASHDFTGIEKNSTKALFHLEGAGGKAVEFKSAVILGQKSTYVCPMHLDVTGEDPGRCSRCGMNLMMKGGQAPQGHAHEEGAEHSHP